jgi:hypothetical protein
MSALNTISLCTTVVIEYNNYISNCNIYLYNTISQLLSQIAFCFAKQKKNSQHVNIMLVYHPTSMNDNILVQQEVLLLETIMALPFVPKLGSKRGCKSRINNIGIIATMLRPINKVIVFLQIISNKKWQVFQERYF